MKEKIAEKWINALRSGEYEQGKGSLRLRNKYCCLGVLCDLYSKENNENWEMFDEKTEQYSFQECLAYLPEKVQKWAGMKTCSGEINHKIDSLTHANDKGFTLEEIAEVIIQNKENL
jgi:hypothetical protein